MIDEGRIEEIRKRCEKATPGPWMLGDGTPGTFYQGKTTVIKAYDMVICDRATAQQWMRKGEAQDNLHFIAHAREDIPYLLSELARLQGEVERVERERDKAVELLENISIVPDRDVCRQCDFYAKCENGQVSRCDNFLWRGVEEDGT